MQQRVRNRPHSFKDQIEAEKARCAEQLADAPHGSQKDELLRKIRELETASDIHDWLRSPGLRMPE